MPREKELYRVNLERIDAAFPVGDLIPLGAAAAFCGLHSKTAAKIFPTVTVNKKKYISKANLASGLS